MARYEMNKKPSLAELEPMILRAQDEISALAHGKRFRMSVPVEDGDSDMVIGDALRHSLAFVRAVLTDSSYEHQSPHGDGRRETETATPLATGRAVPLSSAVSSLPSNAEAGSTPADALQPQPSAAEEPRPDPQFRSGSSDPDFDDWWAAFGAVLVGRLNIEQMALAGFSAGRYRERVAAARRPQEAK